MRIQDAGIGHRQLPGAIPAWQSRVSAGQWWTTCHSARQSGGRLVAFWGDDRSDLNDGFTVNAALAIDSGLLVLTLALDTAEPRYPSIADIFPSANRMQRAVYDLLGMDAQDADDRRPWLRHGAWPDKVFPLRRSFDAKDRFLGEPDKYEFVLVDGDGVHEIPVGPVHAGTIEPGHFRFSTVGERVLRLEERLGYKHKGIEKRFEVMTLTEGAKLAGRVSGDSTVAYAWAYSMAAESIAQLSPPPRALWLRALLLERERIANHLGDLGFLGNDAALSFGLMQFGSLKEEMLRANAALFGHRYLMDVIVPGGVARDIDANGASQIREELSKLEAQVSLLKGIYDEHAGLQDRFMTTGIVTPELAAKLGLVGMAARASGQLCDIRAQFPCAPYDELGVRVIVHKSGDVAARAALRFDEIRESVRLCRLILDGLPSGDITAATLLAGESGFGVGWVEGWRGEVFMALEGAKDNRIRRAHAHDPSWQNWPALEHAVLGNIVPDFPLINKSFNLSYAGHDL